MKPTESYTKPLSAAKLFERGSAAPKRPKTAKAPSAQKIQQSNINPNEQHPCLTMPFPLLESLNVPDDVTTEKCGADCQIYF